MLVAGLPVEETLANLYQVDWFRQRMPPHLPHQWVERLWLPTYMANGGQDWRVATVAEPHTTCLQVNAQRQFVPGEVVKHLVGMRFTMGHLANLSKDQMLNFVTRGTNCSLDLWPMPAILASQCQSHQYPSGRHWRGYLRGQGLLSQHFLSLKDSCKTKH